MHNEIIASILGALIGSLTAFLVIRKQVKEARIDAAAAVNNAKEILEREIRHRDSLLLLEHFATIDEAVEALTTSLLKLDKERKPPGVPLNAHTKVIRKEIHYIKLFAGTEKLVDALEDLLDFKKNLKLSYENLHTKKDGPSSEPTEFKNTVGSKYNVLSNVQNNFTCDLIKNKVDFEIKIYLDYLRT